MTRRSWACFLILLVCLLVAGAAQAQVPTISTYAGGGLPTAGPATATGIGLLGGIGRDATTGNLYFSSNTGVILKFTPSGNLSVFAGSGTCCFSGDGGPATSAQISSGLYIPPGPLKVDPSGNVYYGDLAACVVREINPVTGTITTFAGTPNLNPAGINSCIAGGDGGPATSAQLAPPSGLGFDGAGDLYIADETSCVVRRVDHATGIITTVAGNTALGCATGPGVGDGGAATSAQLFYPQGLAVDGSGNLYIAEVESVRVVNSTTQVITTYAGGGTTDPPTGVVATQADLCCFPDGLAFDPSGNLLIALTEPDTGSTPLLLRVKTSTQDISIIAGNPNLSPGFSGDGNPATSAQLSYAADYLGELDLAVDSTGNIFIADVGNFRLREISAATTNISTVAGNGSVGDGGPATSALIFANAISLDSAGDLYASDPEGQRVRRVDHSTQQVSTVAGMDVGPLQPPSGDGGPATSAQLFLPKTLTMDSGGDLFIADNSGSEVREVSAGTGTISVYAGGHNCGMSGGIQITFCGDGGPATNAGLSTVQSLLVDSGGNLYIADTLNNVVRVVNASMKIITTMAGNTSLVNAQGTPNPGYSGDGGPATSAQLFHPYGLAFDAAGDLYIADSGNNVIREVYCVAAGVPCTPPAGFQAGYINTVAGNFQQGGGIGGDGGPANAAALNSPEGVSFDAYGNLYIGDAGNFRVRVVNSVTGIITTLAGNSFPNFSGDGGPAADAGLYPLHGNGIAVTGGSGGNLLVYVQDEFGGRIRLVTIPPVPAAYVTPAAGLAFTSQQTGTTSAAQSVTITNSGTGPLNVSNVSFTGANSGDFTIAAGGTCTGTSFTVAPTASCTVMVALSPTDTGMLTASLTFTDNAGSGTQSLMLVGSGTPTAPPGAPSGLTASVSTNTVTLNWMASATSGVSYSVYRQMQAGGACTVASTGTYTQIASAVSSTSYLDADPSLMAGNTYCYAVTAVLAGVQSTFSNVATATLTAAFVPTLAITMATLPSGAVGVPYGADIQVSGGTMPYTFAVTSGALPTGFSMTTTASGNVSAGHVYTTSTPPATAGTFTFGVTVTDSSSPTPQMTTVTISLTIGAAPANTQASLLKGQYAILFRAFDEATGSEHGGLGSLDFDGGGNVTGVMDLNEPSSGITQNAAVTGTYSVGPDNRGFLMLTMSGGTFEFAMAVGTVYRGVAYDVSLTKFQDNHGNNTIGSGFLKLQDPTVFNQSAFAGTFVLGATGQDPGLGRWSEAGQISFDNMLNVTSGAIDINDAGSESSVTNITGTYTAPDANGRSALSLTLAPAGSSSVVVYVIDSNDAVIMNLDPRAANPIVIGSVLRQPNPGTFANGNLLGPDVFYFSALKSGGGGSEAVAGAATATGSTLTLTFDQNSAGNVTLNQALGFDYSVAANGRAVATSANAGLICYLAFQDRGFCIIPGDSSAGAGEIIPQSGGPFSASPFGGNVYFGDSETVEAHEALSGVGVLASPGTLNLLADNSHVGGDLTYGITAAYNFSVASNGHLSSTPNTQIGGTTGYVVSPYEAVFFDTGQETGSQGTSGNPSVSLVQTITAPPGTPSPAMPAVNFPTPVPVGSNAVSAPITVTNTGLGPLGFTGVNTTGSPDFSASGTCIPVSPAVVVVVLPQGTCTVIITFAPTASAVTGTPLAELLAVDTDGTTSVNITLTGTVAGSMVSVPASLPFNSVPQLTTSGAMTVTLTNTGMSALDFSAAVNITGANAADFAITANTCVVGTPVAANNGTCMVTLTFTPSTGGSETASLVFMDNATPATQSVSLTGTGIPPSVSYSTFNSFGNQMVGTTSAPQMLTISVAANTGTLQLTSITITGTNKGDFAFVAPAAGTPCPMGAGTVLGGASCTVAFTFTPTATGARTAMLNISGSDLPGGTITFGLNGTGTAPAVTLMPTALTFGVVPLGMSSTLSVTVTNSGTAPLTFNNITITGTNAPDFTLAEGTTCSGDGGQVAAGNSCTIMVTFTPSAIMPEVATLNISDNAANSPQTVSLAGGGPGFTLTVPPPASGGTGLTITVLPGDTAVYTLLITCSPGVTGTVTLAGTGALPPSTILTITPPTITCPSATPVPVQVMLQTNCVPSLVAPYRPGEPGSGPGPGLPGTFAALWVAVILLAAGMRRTSSTGKRAGWARQVAPVCAALVLMLLVMTWTACVSNLPPAIPNAPTTPAGTYPLTIVATGPTGAHVSIVFTVHVI